MKFTPTAIPDVIVVEPKVFGDARGFFMESWNERVFSEAGITARFVLVWLVYALIPGWQGDRVRVLN